MRVFGGAGATRAHARTDARKHTDPEHPGLHGMLRVIRDCVRKDTFTTISEVEYILAVARLNVEFVVAIPQHIIYLT